MLCMSLDLGQHMLYQHNITHHGFSALTSLIPRSINSSFSPFPESLATVDLFTIFLGFAGMLSCCSHAHISIFQTWLLLLEVWIKFFRIMYKIPYCHLHILFGEAYVSTSLRQSLRCYHEMSHHMTVPFFDFFHQNFVLSPIQITSIINRFILKYSILKQDSK